MRYGLRTLLILATLGPPVLAGIWFYNGQLHARRMRRAALVTGSHLKDAASLYLLHLGANPPDLDALVLLPPGVNPLKWGGPYIEQPFLPNDPWNNAFQYEVVDGPRGKFRIWSSGPDGQSGTDDDVEVK